jgi:hypothetical protein
MLSSAFGLYPTPNPTDPTTALLSSVYGTGAPSGTPSSATNSSSTIAASGSTQGNSLNLTA